MVPGGDTPCPQSPPVGAPQQAALGPRAKDDTKLYEAIEAKLTGNVGSSCGGMSRRNSTGNWATNRAPNLPGSTIWATVNVLRGCHTPPARAGGYRSQNHVRAAGISGVGGAGNKAAEHDFSGAAYLGIAPIHS